MTDPHARERRIFRTRRRIKQTILACYAAAMLGCASLVIGPGINDYIIESDSGRALARVTSVTSTKTIVEFQDDTNTYHSPPGGLLYPTGLGPGQRVWVTYARSNPELVKVSGRKWTLAIIPALSSAAVTTLITSALWFAILGPRHFRRAKHANHKNHTKPKTPTNTTVITSTSAPDAADTTRRKQPT